MDGELRLPAPAGQPKPTEVLDAGRSNVRRTRDDVWIIELVLIALLFVVRWLTS
jgi:hypothetical protein